MRALVLGATGQFASVTARHLVDGGKFEKVICGSRSLEKVAPLAEEMGPAAEARAVNLHDKGELIAVAREVDVVVNGTGPALETSVPAMIACAEAGTHYCDIAGEVGVLEQAEEHADLFEESGATILVGAGFHPGVNDLLGELAVRSLDQVDSVDFHIVGTYADFADPKEMIAAIDGGWEIDEGTKGLIHAAGNPATIVVDGKRQSADPRTHTKQIVTPDGVGCEAATIGTLEPLALHRRHPGIENLAACYGAWPVSAFRILTGRALDLATAGEPVTSAVRELWVATAEETAPSPKVQFWVVAKGTKDGERASATVYSKEPWASNLRMLETTTGFFAYAAEALAAGRISRRGLVTSVDVFEPTEIFDAVSENGRAQVEVDFAPI